jgi:glycosyltransferase involved in cell wall biosynthesis
MDRPHWRYEMPNFKKVSVVIPCYNAGPVLREALDSVLSEGYPNLEVICVDDGSTDDTLEILREYEHHIVLHDGPNGGVSVARNIGTALAQGAYIKYLDQDDILLSGGIQTQVEALELSGGDVAYGNWQRLEQQEDGSFALANIEGNEIEGEHEVALLFDFFCQIAAYLFRRTIVDRVGGFSENLPIEGDVRLVLGCAIEGAGFVHCDQLVSLYRIHADSQCRRDQAALHREICALAREIEEIWRKRDGTLDAARRNVLARAYGRVSRNLYDTDPDCAQLALEAIERLEPDYVPQSPARLRLASRWLGYRRAEALFCFYRTLKRGIPRR